MGGLCFLRTDRKCPGHLSIPQNIISNFKMVWKALLGEYHLWVGEMPLKEETKKIYMPWTLQEIMRREGFEPASSGQIP